MLLTGSFRGLLSSASGPTFLPAFSAQGRVSSSVALLCPSGQLPPARRPNSPPAGNMLIPLQGAEGRLLSILSRPQVSTLTGPGDCFHAFFAPLSICPS